MVWSSNSQVSTGTPCDARTGFERAPHGNLQCFSYPTEPVWGPCGTRKCAIRHPRRHGSELTQPESAQISQGVVFGRMGSTRAPYGPRKTVHGLSTISKPVRAYKLIIHASKHYGPRTGRQNSYGAARVLWVDIPFWLKTAREQPGNNPYGDRECDVIIRRTPH